MRGETEPGIKTAFLSSGQRIQYPDARKDLYESYNSTKAVLDSIVTDFDVKTLCSEGPKEQLDNTQYIQVAIFAHTTAIATVLQENGVHTGVIAGLSLGEYSALCYADCFSVQASAKVLQERGKLMANTPPSGTSAMTAVLILDKEAVLNACEAVQGIGVREIANYNCPGQIIITGERAAIETCGKKRLEADARRVIPLQASGTFHSSLLQEAGKQLRQVLPIHELETSRIPVLYSLTAGIAGCPLIDLLSGQISHGVLLEDTIRNILADSVDTFIEVSSGKAASDFVKKCARDMDMNILYVEDVANLAETLDCMKG